MLLPVQLWSFREEEDDKPRHKQPGALHIKSLPHLTAHCNRSCSQLFTQLSLVYTMAPLPEATTVDKFKMLPILAMTIGAIMKRLLIRSFTNSHKPDTLLKDLFFTGLRTAMASLSQAQEQLLVTPPVTAYRKFASTKAFTPVIDTLNSGLQCCWLGDKTAHKILLFFHGGGFFLGASPGHFSWLYELQTDLQGRLESLELLLEDLDTDHSVSERLLSLETLLGRETETRAGHFDQNTVMGRLAHLSHESLKG